MNHSANGIIAVGAPHSEARKQNNLEGFMRVYKEELIKAVMKYPKNYTWDVSKADEVAEKMRVAFIKGSYNKDSEAIKATCKHLGLKHTYQIINAFFQGD